jgi:hypothetical protein
MKKYDIAIIGGGIGGIMAAYELTKHKYRVCILEKGKPLNRRSCPILCKKTSKCLKCATCAIMEGMAGAGAFSDGKYIISTEYGGWLTEFLSPETVLSYIEKADSILMEYGATSKVFTPDDELKRLCLRHDLHMLQAKLKHLGTDDNYETMLAMVNDLSAKCDIFTDTEAVTVDKAAKLINGEIQADKIIFAVGRAGSGFFADWCTANGIGLTNNQVDIGVRVELPALVWEHFSSRIYEPKINFRSKRYGDTTRMFCFNERGSVVTENTHGVLTVNGHSYKNKKTENSNFALLSTMKFTEPFNEPIAYAKHVASLANLISGDSVIVQRLGDLEVGRRTDGKRLMNSTVKPTLAAVPGDLSLCMPKRQLDNIVETLHALDKVAPGTANYDTLLYGVECKYYSSRPEHDDFEIYDGIYAIGDGAGFTRSLSHAAAQGLYVAGKIIGG